MAQNITLLGASYADVPAVELPKTGGGTATFTDVSPTTAGAADVASGKLFFDALGVLTQGTASGGGGASNVVTGTFKGTTTEAAMDVNLAYSGNGYPIAVMVFPEEGPYNSGTGSFYSLLQRYAVAWFSFTKLETNTVPSYPSSVNTESKNAALGYSRYKSSSSNPGLYSGAAQSTIQLFYDHNAANSSAQCVRIRSNKKMSVFIAGTSYGFAANITYRYWVIYSE